MTNTSSRHSRTHPAFSLRQTVAATLPGPLAGTSASVLALACLGVMLPGTAQGQGAAGGTQLPAVTVEAPATQQKKTVRRAASQRRQASRPARSGAEPRQAAAPAPAPQASAPQLAPNANPHAAPGAPFNIQRSTSTKLTEPLANTPRTVTAVPKEVLEEKQATSLRELVRTTPGLTLGSGEGGNAFGDRVFIRGFDARNDMFIDGVRDSSVTTRETFMVEQVEVTKGPAGAISGRGTTGGSINLAVKKPAALSFRDFGVTMGSDMTKRFTADVNQVISPDLAIRANGMWQNADVAGRDEVKDDRWGGAFSMVWKPWEKFRIGLDYHHIDMDQSPDWGVPFDVLTHKPLTESGLRRSSYYGLPARDFQKGKQDVLTGAIEIGLNDESTLTSKTRYGLTSIDYIASAPGTPDRSNRNPLLWTVPVSAKSRYQTNEIAANQTDLTTKFETFGLKHTVVTGFEVSQEKVSIDNYQGLATESFGAAPSTSSLLNLWAPFGQGFTLSSQPLRTGQPRVVTVNTASLYAIDTVSWQDRLFLNAGIRLDNYELTNQPFTGLGQSRADSLLNYNLGLTYKLLPELAVYAAYGTSSNPVGSELDGSSDAYGGLNAQNQLFRPERNTSTELGAKWELFNRRLLLTAALFQTEKTNARESMGSGAAATLIDSAAYRIRGVEFGVGGNVTDKLSLFGGAVFMQSEQTRSIDPANVGMKLANIAHQSFNLLARYQLTDQWSVSGQATYKSEIYGGTLAATLYGGGTVTIGGVPVAVPYGYNRLPGGWRFDLMSEYRFNKTFSLDVKVLNLFNKTLYDAFYRSASPYVYIAPGRAAYVTLKASF